MKKIKHTPIPWVVGEMGHDTDVDTQIQEMKADEGTEREWAPIGIEDKDGFAEVVALAHPSNAEFIVRAVNNHKALLAALQGYIQANRTARDDNDFRCKIALAQQFAEAAIRKARGGK